ncbi:MAG: DoxX family protein [Chitinophagaceae bacterium]
MMHLFKKITQPVVLNWHSDLLLSIPRIVCGYLLTTDFGSDKFGMPWSDPDKNLQFFEVVFWFPEDVASYGGIFALFPNFFAWMAAFSEAVGGLLLVVGFQTRIAGALLVATMLGAIFLQQIQSGLWNTLPPLGFLWVGLFALTLGSGRFGIDYFISKKMNHAKK